MNWIPNVNPQTQVLKKYIFEIIKEKYAKHENIIDRLSVSLITRNDFEEFGRLIADIFESGYMRSLQEQKDILTKAGINVVVKPSEKPKSVEPIFKHQSEK